MNILIVEDEKRVGRQLEKMVREIIGRNIQQLELIQELDEAMEHLEKEKADLLFLDLNINEEDGFDLLRMKSAYSFYTIITSAYRQEAIQAYEYGVIDFVPKPFVKERLEIALQRYFARAQGKSKGYLVLKTALENNLIDLDKVFCLEAQGRHSLVWLQSKTKEPHHKSLDQLQQLLPSSFERVHKSFIVNMDKVRSLQILPGSRYTLLMENEEVVPVGRVYYRKLKGRFY